MNIFVRESVASVEQAIMTIMDQLEDPSSKIVVGLDTEWNVDLLHSQARDGPTAVIQIAFGKQIYVMLVS